MHFLVYDSDVDVCCRVFALIFSSVLHFDWNSTQRIGGLPSMIGPHDTAKTGIKYGS